MRSFTYDAKPGRVVFGVGAIDTIADEIKALGVTRALVISSSGRAALASQVSESLGPLHVATFAEALPHVPIEQAEQVRAIAREVRADGVIGLGGGSPVGLAKAVALTCDVRQVAVPTTYAGSEMTAIVGITRDGVKRTTGSPRILSQLVIYDPALTVGLPAHATATTGMNALAHCVEALYAPSANPVADLAAEEGIETLASALPRAVADPADIDARTNALRGAYLAGVALGSTDIAIHHKICHVLGGTYGIGHGDANAVMLPYVVRYNEPAAVDAIAIVARALGVDDAAHGLRALVVEMGLPTSLQALGLDATALDNVGRLTMETTKQNPRPMTTENVRALLDQAYHGQFS